MLTFVIPAHKMPPSEVAFVRRMLLQGGMDSQVRLVHDAYIGLLYTCFCRSTRSLVPRPEKETVFNSRQLYSLYPQQAAQSDVLGYIFRQNQKSKTTRLLRQTEPHAERQVIDVIT